MQENKCTHCKQIIWDGTKRIPHKPGCTNIQPRKRKHVMLHKMYSIRDMKSETYGPPHAAPTHGAAERNFGTLVNQKETTIHQHPGDYDLFYIGTYDDNSGKFTALDAPEHIISAASLKNSRPQLQEV